MLRNARMSGLVTPLKTMILSSRFEQALVYAAIVHAGQRRKGKK